MSYTVINFKTKKALKEAIAQYLDREIVKGNPVRCYNPGLGGDLSNHTGKVYLEGPHYPEAHKWYAEGEMKDGVLIKVK
jgi:hypothetical protein